MSINTGHASTGAEPAARGGAAAMSAAKPPVGPGTISWIGIVLALVVVAVGVLALQTAAVALGAIARPAWLGQLVRSANGLTPTNSTLAAAVVVALLGAWCIFQALRPRRRTAVALQAETGVFLRPRDLGRLAADAAEDVDGVREARAFASRRRVSVEVVTTGGQGVEQAVAEAVRRRLDSLAKPVRVSVRRRRGAP